MDLDPTKTMEPGTPSPEEASIPAFIGSYKIHSLLKRGGMSLIYLAAHPKTAETVVVKVVLPKYLKSKEMLSRLLREAKILSITSHPNIVRLFDLGRGDQGLFVVMEYIQGVSLRQFMKTQSLTHKRALEIILQVAYALAHLHSHGVIHRDLKPDNILITESGSVKLIDFGISQFLEGGDLEDKTQRLARAGTPNYMSPEQKEKPFKLSYSTDIFSLGIIAYELYLGHHSHGIIQLNVLPRPLQAILGKALQIDPAKRYPDIVDFIADISDYIKKLDASEPEEVSEEAYDMVAASRSLLLPEKMPDWPEMDVGTKIIEGRSLGGFYLDFFRFSSVHFGCVIAEPEGAENDPSHLTYSAMLCGMVKAFADRDRFEHGPFLGMLNRFFVQVGKKYSLVCLILDVEKNQLSFASCGRFGPLWHFQADKGKLRKLEEENPALGEQASRDFLVIKENWNSGDSLLFGSFPIEPSVISQLETKCILAAKPLADFIGEAYAPSQKSAAFVAIKRL